MNENQQRRQRHGQRPTEPLSFEDAADATQAQGAPDLDLDKLNELEALARAATPGEWENTDRTVFVLEHHGWRKGVEQMRNRFSCTMSHDGSGVPQEELHANAAFIAAANPQTVRALIEQARRAEESVTQYQQSVHELAEELREARRATAPHASAEPSASQQRDDLIAVLDSLFAVYGTLSTSMKIGSERRLLWESAYRKVREIKALAAQPAAVPGQQQQDQASADPVVEANRALLLERSRVGIKKYGTTLGAARLSRQELAQHALEEALDLANYLQTIIQTDKLTASSVSALIADDGYAMSFQSIGQYRSALLAAVRNPAPTDVAKVAPQPVGFHIIYDRGTSIDYKADARQAHAYARELVRNGWLDVNVRSLVYAVDTETIAPPQPVGALVAETEEALAKALRDLLRDVECKILDGDAVRDAQALLDSLDDDEARVPPCEALAAIARFAKADHPYSSATVIERRDARAQLDAIAARIGAIDAPTESAATPANAKFQRGDEVRKTKGSKWAGKVVGTYSTDLTPEGYAVESSTEHGSVQIYPAAALELVATPTTQQGGE